MRKVMEGPEWVHLSDGSRYNLTAVLSETEIEQIMAEHPGVTVWATEDEMRDHFREKCEGFFYSVSIGRLMNEELECESCHYLTDDMEISAIDGDPDFSWLDEQKKADAPDFAPTASDEYDLSYRCPECGHEHTGGSAVYIDMV